MCMNKNFKFAKRALYHTLKHKFFKVTYRLLNNFTYGRIWFPCLRAYFQIYDTRNFEISCNVLHANEGDV